MRKFAMTEFAKKTNTATNINETWNHFMDILKACRDKFISQKIIKRGRGIKQQMPYESKIIQIIRKKASMLAEVRRNEIRTEIHWVQETIKSSQESDKERQEA